MLLVLLLPSGRVLGRGARRRCLARRGRPLLLLGRDSSSGRSLLCPELGGRRSFSGGRLFGVGLLLDRGLLGELLLAGFAGLALLAGDLLTGLLLLGLALALLDLLPGGLGAVTLLLLFALLLAGFALGAGLLFPAGDDRSECQSAWCGGRSGEQLTSPSSCGRARVHVRALRPGACASPLLCGRPRRRAPCAPPRA